MSTYYQLFKKYESQFESYGVYNKSPSNFIKDHEDNLKINNNYYHFISKREFENLMKQTNISNEERIIINKTYIGHVFSWHLNAKLRKSENLETKENLVKCTLKNIINKNILKNNYLCKRYVKLDYIENVFGIYPSKLNDYNLRSKLNEHVGSVKVEKGFMSCSMTNTHIIEGECLLNVYVNSGKKAFITDNLKETEIIFDCNTRYKILKVEVKSTGKLKIIINILIL